MQYNKKKFIFSYKAMINDFASKKRTHNLRDGEINLLLLQPKRINFPIFFINNKVIKEKYKATFLAQTISSIHPTPQITHNYLLAAPFLLLEKTNVQKLVILIWKEQQPHRADQDQHQVIHHKVF